MAAPEVALVLRPCWAQMIVDGAKTLELRGALTRKRGLVALAAAGTSQLLGQCRIAGSYKIAEWDDDSQRYIDCPPLSLRRLTHVHQVQDVEETLRRLNYKEVHGWVLQDVEKYKPPRQYQHTSGCVSWVRLTGKAPAAKKTAAARPMKRPGKCQR